MNFVPYIGAAVGCLTLLGAGYAVMTKAGYVVSESQAQTIAKQEVVSESVERMEFQLEYKLSELRRYESIPESERTAADRVQIQELNKQISWLQDQLRNVRGY